MRSSILVLLMGLLLSCATPALNSPEADGAIADALLSELKNSLNLNEVERSTLGDGVLLNNAETMGIYLNASLIRQAFNLDATGFVRFTNCHIGAYGLTGYIDLIRQIDEIKGNDARISQTSSPITVRLGDKVAIKPVHIIIFYENGQYNDPLIWVNVNGSQRGKLPHGYLSTVRVK